MRNCVIAVMLSVGLSVHAQWEQLQSGDLLFICDTNGMGQAVKESTGQYTHVAMIERCGDSVFIIDATPTFGVCRQQLSPLTFHLSPYHIYRLTVSFDTTAVITRAKSLIGKPYDNAFLPDNDAYYCSEFIQTVFGNIFPSKPMNWRDKEGNLPEYWIKHFEALGMPIPEGIPGTNPTDLSRSPVLKKQQ